MDLCQQSDVFVFDKSKKDKVGLATVEALFTRNCIYVSTDRIQENLQLVLFRVFTSLSRRPP